MSAIITPTRQATICRRTAETRIELELALDGTGECHVRTGLGFLDHMLTCLCRHGRLDLRLDCRGDLEVDDHHTVEDCALTLGQGLDRALGQRRDFARFGWAYAPLDEALARAVVDWSGRPSPHIALALTRERIGDVACESLTHFFQSLAVAARCALHVDVLKGDNDHHRVEAAFKACALALRQAVARDAGAGVPSTKEVLP